MHDNRRYVKSRNGRPRRLLKRVLPLLVASIALAAATPADAAVLPGTEAVEDASVSTDAQPRIAFVRGRDLWTLRVGRDLDARRAVALPDGTGRVAAVRATWILVESRVGTWLRLVVLRNGRWRARRVADAPKDGVLGPAGLAATRRGRPVVSYTVRLRDESTELWLVQEAAQGRLVRTRVTRRGFPNSRVPPASAPLLMPDGTIRIVQTFVQRGANAIFWRRERARWWGRVLFASALGVSAFPIFAALSGDDLFLAWTVAYEAQGEQHVVLTTRTDRSTSIVVHRSAQTAGLALGPNGPEVAANEDVAGLNAGLVSFPTIVNGAIRYTPPVELDGLIVGYARAAAGWQVLLVRDGHLEWFASPAAPHVRIYHEGGLSGRVEGVAGGSVRIYRERSGAPRQLVAEAPVAADGRFAASDPAPVSGTHYRFVYESDFPYSLLLRVPTP
jgi:hypothetical protein